MNLFLRKLVVRRRRLRRRHRHQTVEARSFFGLHLGGLWTILRFSAMLKCDGMRRDRTGVSSVARDVRKSLECWDRNRPIGLVVMARDGSLEYWEEIVGRASTVGNRNRLIGLVVMGRDGSLECYEKAGRI